MKIPGYYWSFLTIFAIANLKHIMKKITLLAVMAVTIGLSLNAQTKQGANAMRSSDPSQLPLIVQSSQAIQPNTTTQTISGYYQQGFEALTFPPAGCRVDNVAGPTYTWARSTAQAHLSTASAFIRYDNIAGGGQDWLMMPRYLVTATTDSMVFWMRLAFAGYQPDSLCIKVSTTDSLVSSFGTTLLKLREGTNYPTNSTTWYRYAVSLSAYNGQQIYIAFKHYNIDGDGLYVDDVAIGTRPANEVSTTAMISPTATVGAGSIIPQATFFNSGSATPTFNVTTDITPGGYTSTQTITALAPNTSANASFAPWSATPGTYTVKTYTQLPGDANMANDTLTRIVTVLSAYTQYGWDVNAALPAGRWATGPVFVKECLSSTDTGFIYLISGADAAFANTTLNTRYNTVTGAYTAMAPIPQSRTQISPIHVRGKIYVIGGYGASFSPVTTNSIYDIATNTWTTGATIPQQVGDYAIGKYNDSLIYVIGGYTGAGDVNLVQIYNTYTNTWSVGTPKTGTTVAGCRMGISDNKIVFVGGYSQTLAATQSAALLGTIDVNNPATIVWTALPNYPAGPTGRHGAGTAFEDNGNVYFAGGDPTGQGTQVLNATYAYNTILSQWETGPNMPVGVSNITNLAGALTDSLYMVTMGGYNGAAVVTSNDWLNIGPHAPLPVGPADVAICNGNSTTLTAMNAVSYAWSPSTNLSSTNTASTVANPTTTTTYSVTMGKGYGCPVVDPVTVTVNPLPIVVANSTATTVCSGDAVTLTGSGAVSYTWTGNVTDNVAFNPTTTDTYTVTGTDANGCMNTANITVNVNALPVVVANATSTVICSGDAVTLFGSGATSYTWSNNVIDNVAFTPTVSDVYTVTGMDANGCMNTDVIPVTVNTLPTVVANATATTVCNGDSVTLSGSGALNYTWTGNVTDNVAFAPAATDTYTVTGTDGNGCMNTDNVTVTVNALPTVVANSSTATACAGTFITLTGSGATTYTWTGNVTDNTPFQPTATATYTVTGTDGNGCMNTDNVTVTINQLPVVVGNATQTAVCTGSPVTLTGSGASTYTWTNSVVDGVSFVPASTNTYTVTGTDANGCMNTDEVTVTVNPNPVVTLTLSQSTICVDDANLVLSGGSPVGGTYSGNGVNAGSFDPSVPGAGNTSITYQYTDANGCEAAATTSITVDLCTGIASATNVNGINIYPNPNAGQFTIQLSSAPVDAVQVEVTNGLGQVIDAFTMTETSKEINIATLDNGVYFIRVINGSTVTVQRIVKQ